MRKLVLYGIISVLLTIFVIAAPTSVVGPVPTNVAPINSPTFTGTPLTTSPSVGDYSQQLSPTSWIWDNFSAILTNYGVRQTDVDNLVNDLASKATKAGTTTNDNASAGNLGQYISSSVVQGSAVTLTTATPKTVTSISLTAGDWDVTAIGSLTGASTGTEFDVAIGTTTDSLTGTVLGDTRCQTPTVSLTGADASLMVPSVRVSIASTTTYYLITQETFTVGTPKAYGRISARRVR